MESLLKSALSSGQWQKAVKCSLWISAAGSGHYTQGRERRQNGRTLANMAAESITNRKALRDYHILDRYEAGIELKGSEVKSIRAGKANISDAFARIENGEAFLYNADIQPYERASHEIPDAKRVRGFRAGALVCARTAAGDRVHGVVVRPRWAPG